MVSNDMMVPKSTEMQARIAHIAETGDRLAKITSSIVALEVRVAMTKAHVAEMRAIIAKTGVHVEEAAACLAQITAHADAMEVRVAATKSHLAERLARVAQITARVQAANEIAQMREMDLRSNVWTRTNCRSG